MRPAASSTEPNARLADLHRSPTSGLEVAAGGRWLTACADVGRIGILAGAAAFLATGDGSAALRVVLVIPAALAPRIVRVNPLVDLAFTLALAAEAIVRGAVGYYSDDALSHIILPLLAGPVLYAGLARLGATPAPSGNPGPVGVGLATVTGLLAVGAVWELVEWVADSLVGTNYSQGYRDTTIDLFNDTIAAIASGILVAVWICAHAARTGLPPLMVEGRSGGALKRHVA